MQKKVKDIKPIITEDDDDQDISNLNKDNVVTNKDVISHIKLPKPPDQVYSQPIKRPPPRPPDLSEYIPRSQHILKPTLILKRIPLIRKA